MGVCAAVLGLLLLLRVLCAARDYRRQDPVAQQQFIMPERRAMPFSAPAVVPVQVQFLYAPAERCAVLYPLGVDLSARSRHIAGL